MKQSRFPHPVSTKTFVSWSFILTFDVLYKKAAFLGEGQKLAEVKEFLLHFSNPRFEIKSGGMGPHAEKMGKNAKNTAPCLKAIYFVYKCLQVYFYYLVSAT